MDITLQNKSISLKEFIYGHMSQAVVESSKHLTSGGTNIMFMFKITDKDFTESIYFQTLYVSRSDDYTKHEIKDIRYLMSINHNPKYVIYEKTGYIDVVNELSDAEGFQFFTPDELKEEMKIKYTETFLRILNGKLPELRETDKYKESLLKVKEDEPGMEEEIHKDILCGRNESIPYSIAIFDEMKWSYENRGEYIDFTSHNLSLYHSYLSGEHYIETIAERNFFADCSMDDIAYVNRYQELKEYAINNPDEEIILSAKIKKAIESAGKTLTIKTKDGNIHKVDNSLRNGTQFGYNTVDIEEIDVITFSGKVIFKAEN